MRTCDFHFDIHSRIKSRTNVASVGTVQKYAKGTGSLTFSARSTKIELHSIGLCTDLNIYNHSTEQNMIFTPGRREQTTNFFTDHI